MKTNKSTLFFFAFLIGEMYWYSIGAPNLTFICHNKTAPNYYGEFISGDYFCDGKFQCGDGEDEHLGCKREGNNLCKKGQFSCDSDECLNITVRCNTKKDCKDGTDEQNCGDEIDVNNCTSDDKFLCKDGLRCLGLEYTCDDECNCFDCSDEDENCLKHDDNLSKKCPRSYFETPNGPRCFCGSDNTNSSVVCNNINRCPSLYVRKHRVFKCEQRCMQFKRKTQCSCYKDYTMMNGTFGSKCRGTRDIAILYSNENEIKLLNNTSLKTSTIVQGIDNCTLLTAANNHVYYTTLSLDNKTSIFKKALNSGKPEKLIETDFAITSIAVDYITNNIYFTGDGSLSVCTSNGQICTRLKCCNVDLVTLTPKYGWMFYMRRQLDTPQEMYCQNGFLLTRSHMDGSNETIHTNRCFKSEVLMEMDESKNVLNLLRITRYDSTYIDQMLVVGNPFETTMENMLLTNKIRHFSFHNDEMFCTVKGLNGIFYIHNMSYFDFNSESEKERIISMNDNSTSTITDLYVYNTAIQRSNENPCEKSPCSGLCLLKPEMFPSKYFLSHTCICDGFTPSSDNPWCSNDSTSSNAVVWLITCVSVLIILCAIAYLFKSNWRRYLPVIK